MNEPRIVLMLKRSYAAVPEPQWANRTHFDEAFRSLFLILGRMEPRQHVC
jgi:hypothetical protein